VFGFKAKHIWIDIICSFATLHFKLT
jgi:hypothetical protein